MLMASFSGPGTRVAIAIAVCYFFVAYMVKYDHFQGRAPGLLPGEEFTTVAVKMLKVPFYTFCLAIIRESISESLF